MPFESKGDFMAQLQTARLGGRRIAELYDKFGAQTVEKCLSTYLAEAENRMRLAIAALPDGTYFAEDYLENSGTSADPVVVRCKTEIAEIVYALIFLGRASKLPVLPTHPIPAACAVCLTCLKHSSIRVN